MENNKIPERIDYLLNKKYYGKYSKYQLRNYFCGLHCWGPPDCDDRIGYETMCENCKNDFQTWSSNFVISDEAMNEYREIDPDPEDDKLPAETWKRYFLEDTWYKYRSINSLCLRACEDKYEIKRGCSDSSCYTLGDKENGEYSQMNFLGLCSLCDAIFTKKRIEDGELKHNDLSDLNTPPGYDFMHFCSECKDVVCSHYFYGGHNNDHIFSCDNCLFQKTNNKYQLSKYFENKVKELEIELRYRPGGEGAKEAQKHFEELVENNAY